MTDKPIINKLSSSPIEVWRFSHNNERVLAKPFKTKGETRSKNVLVQKATKEECEAEIVRLNLS